MKTGGSAGQGTFGMASCAYLNISGTNATSVILKTPLCDTDQYMLGELKTPPDTYAEVIVLSVLNHENIQASRSIVDVAQYCNRHYPFAENSWNNANATVYAWRAVYKWSGNHPAQPAI